MKKYSHYILLHTALFFFSAISFAQQSVMVTATVDKNRIIIGEPIKLKLEAALPAGTPMLWFDTDSLPHFELIDKGNIDSSAADKYEQIVTITSFDSGLYVIPPLSLDLDGRSYLTDSIPITVSFSAFDPEKDYHDIKDILEVEAVKKTYLKEILLAGGILMLLLLAWFLYRKYRRKKPVTQVAAPFLSPLEEALRALEALKKEPITEKQFYTGMNDIIRGFVYRKTGVTTMQKTNEEFILQLDKLGMPQDDFISLVQTLRMSDAVKFARYVPGEEENEKNYTVIRRSVEQLNNTNNSAV